MSRNKTCSNGFQVCPIFPFEFYCYLFFPFILHKSGTSIAFYIICRVNCISGVMVRFLVSSAVDCWFEPWSGQTKEYKIYICCFSAKHAAFRRKSKDWLAQNQDNVSKCSDMSIRGLLFQ
jgi:hypothetical protein